MKNTRWNIIWGVIVAILLIPFLFLIQSIPSQPKRLEEKYNKLLVGQWNVRGIRTYNNGSSIVLANSENDLDRIVIESCGNDQAQLVTDDLVKFTLSYDKVNSLRADSCYLKAEIIQEDCDSESQ